jgi:hypothetical protein
MPAPVIIREGAEFKSATMSESRWIPLGGGQELKLACHGGSWRWADWRIQRGFPPVAEVVPLPPPPAEDAARQFASPEAAVAFFAVRRTAAVPSSSREARAATPLGKAARRF